jgi:hypothetical protein
MGIVGRQSTVDGRRSTVNGSSQPADRLSADADRSRREIGLREPTKSRDARMSVSCRRRSDCNVAWPNACTRRVGIRAVAAGEDAHRAICLASQWRLAADDFRRERSASAIVAPAGSITSCSPPSPITSTSCKVSSAAATRSARYPPSVASSKRYLPPSYSTRGHTISAPWTGSVASNFGSDKVVTSHPLQHPRQH